MPEVWSTAELFAAGWTERRLARAVADGSILRIRRDNYCAPATAREVIEAVRIGGRVGCVSLLRLLGVWVSRQHGLHLHVAPDATRLRAGAATRHWVAGLADGDRARVSVLDAVLVAMLCQGFLDAVALADSARHLGLVRLSELSAHAVDPARRRILSYADGAAESGVESILRVALLLVGLRVEIQAQLSGIGRVDLLVEGCVVVEVDGAAFQCRSSPAPRSSTGCGGRCAGLDPAPLQRRTGALRAAVGRRGRHRRGARASPGGFLRT